MIRIALAFATLLLLAAPTSAQDGLDPVVMQKWMEYMTPGEPHAYLAGQDGEWEYTMTMWMEPGAPPIESSGTVVSAMILGGRYQTQTYEGSFMGMAFEGYSITGYDNDRGEFFNVWFDNMGTGMLEMRGEYDPAVKTLALSGSLDDPITGAKDLGVRSVTKTVDDDHMIFEMYMETVEGEEFRTMEIHAFRRTP